MAKLSKELNIFYLIIIGISNIIGAGIFVVSGLAAGVAGPSVVLSFFIASLVALFTGLTIAELSSAITETGEAYAYSKKAFGNLIAFLTGITKVLNNILSTAAVAMGFSFYLTAFFLSSANDNLIILFSFVIITFSALLNLLGVSKMSKAASFLTLFKIFVLSFFIILGIFYIKDHFDESKIRPFFPNGFPGTLQAASLVFFAFIGFQTIAIASEESKNPKKEIPIAILSSIFICYTFYTLISLVQVLIVNWKILGRTEHSLLYVTSVITNNYFVKLLITSAGLASMASVILTTVYSGSRIVFALSRDDFLPKKFSELSKFKTPIYAILLVLVLSSLMLITKNLMFLVSFTNFGYLFSFLIANLSLIKLRGKIKPKFKLPFHPLIPLLGFFSILLLLFSLDNTTKIVGIVFILLSSLIYFSVVKRK